MTEPTKQRPLTHEERQKLIKAPIIFNVYGHSRAWGGTTFEDQRLYAGSSRTQSGRGRYADPYEPDTDYYSD